MIRLSSGVGRHSRDAGVRGCCRPWSTRHPLIRLIRLCEVVCGSGQGGTRYKRLEQGGEEVPL